MKRRGESAISTLIALAILGVALYMVFPSWFAWLPIGQSSTISGEITINYEDGTSRIITSNSLRVASIEDSSGKGISSIGYVVKCTPTYTGTPTSSAVTGNVVCSVSSVSKRTTAVTYSTLIPTGSTVTVNTGSVTAATLESWNTAAGTHTLKIEAPLTFTANYASGPSSKTGTFSAVITYDVVTYGVTALSVSVTTTVS